VGDQFESLTMNSQAAMQIGNSQTEFMRGQPARSMLPRFPATIEWMEQVGQRCMLVKSEEYRKKASECAELAATTIDPVSKQILEETAQHWDALADGLEKYEARLRSRIVTGYRPRSPRIVRV
jgi:hypothetical protein